MKAMGSVGEKTEFGRPMKAHFLFDPKHTNLNHGSYGTYPMPVRNALRGYQKLAEAAPDKFLRYQYVNLLDKARDRVAQVLNAPADECVFVQNATSGINLVLRNLQYKENDCIIYFDTIYGACEKTLASIQETNPQLQLRKVSHGQDFGYSLPCTHAEILNAFSQTISRLIYDGLTPKVAVFDTIVSLPGVRFPFERITRMCKEHNILSVIDGAHGIGQIPLNLSQLDADFFVSNCHKWLYTPRGCAVLHVPQRNQHLIRTTYPTSHGYRPLASDEATIRNPMPPSDKGEFVDLFQYVATTDNCPYYCVPAALNFRQNLCGGEEAIYTYIRDIAQRGADLLAMILGTEVMDDLDPGEGLKAMGSLEGSDRRAGGRHGYQDSIRDCAMANVLLPITIAGASSMGSLSLGPGGAGSGGGLAPGLRKTSKRQTSLGFSSSRNPSIASLATPWTDTRRISWSPVRSPIGSPSIDTISPVMVMQEDVGTHIAWMQKTLVDEFNTFVAIYEYHGKIWTRISGQIYLELKDFEWLGGVLTELCERVGDGESLRRGDEMVNLSTVASEMDLEELGRRESTVSISLTPVMESQNDFTRGRWQGR